MDCRFKIISFLLSVQGTRATYEDFLCPTKPSSSVFFPCDGDCRDQHGAVGGKCGDASKGDFNCYCGELTSKRYEPSLHCMKNEKRYEEICSADCQCNHGATDGVCNWELKACVCQGKNPKNIGCPAKSVREFAQMVYDKAGPSDLGVKGILYVKPMAHLWEVKQDSKHLISAVLDQAVNGSSPYKVAPSLFNIILPRKF